MTKQQLIDRKIIVDREIAKLKAAISFVVDVNNKRNEARLRRSMHDELADLKATSQRLQQAIGKTPAMGEPTHILYWFERAAKVELSPDEYQIVWDRAHAMRDAYRMQVADEAAKAELEIVG